MIVKNIITGTFSAKLRLCSREFHCDEKVIFIIVYSILMSMDFQRQIISRKNSIICKSNCKYNFLLNG